MTKDHCLLRKNRTCVRFSPQTSPKCNGPLGGAPEEKVVRAKFLLRGLTLTLRHHDCPRKVVTSFEKQVEPYLTIDDEITFIARAKHLMLWPMSRYLNNPPPKEPDMVLKWSGAWWAWSRQRLHTFTKRNTHLWYSFLQGKRAAKPVSQDVVIENYLKHRQQMAEPDPIDEFAQTRIMTLLDPVLEQIGSSLLRGHQDLLLDPYKVKFQPSLGACYHDYRAEAKGRRADGGARGTLRCLLGLNYCVELINSDEKFSCEREETELHSMTLLPGITRVGNSLQVTAVVEMRYRKEEERELEDLLVGDALSLTATPRALYAQVCAVLEPLKVRTISKGEATFYTAAKRFQKALHHVMRRRPEFRLIGRPLCPTDLMSIRQSYLESGGSLEESKWLSVDYSAATDGLSAKLSHSILKRIIECSGLRPDSPYGNLLLSTLAPHYVTYPLQEATCAGEFSRFAGHPAVRIYQQSFRRRAKWWLEIESIQQQNGQLMGSITSFPILCLANLGLYLWVRSLSRPDWSLSNMLKSVLINGDDMLYEGNLDEFRTHDELGERVGLRQAPGKSYIHESYANMNSMCFHFGRKQRGNDTPLYIPFLNTGLFFGQNKVLGKSDTDDKSPIGQRCSTFNKVVEGAWRGKQSDIAKQYLSLHKTEIREECKGRNLFLPVSLGGMGVEPWLEPRITKDQRRAISTLINTPGRMPASRPLPRHIPIRDGGEISQDLILVRDHLRMPVSHGTRRSIKLGSQFCTYDPCGLVDGLLQNLPHDQGRV